MKKIISFILSICVFAMGLPFVISFADSIDYPEEGNENGYLFMLSDSSENIDIEKYPDVVAVTSELARIYFVQDLDVIKSISNIYDIEYVEPNVPKPIYTENEERSISLFSETVSEDENVDETETTVPIANDPLYQYQWSHEAVNAKAFWNNGVTGEGIKVGVIDTGINREHSAFNGVNIETGINVCAYVAKDEENLYNTADTDGHGTAVTSIICSTINDGIGMAGLTDKVTIVPYKIHDSNYASYIDGAAFLRAIDLAYQDNCDVLNISQGSTTRYDIEEQLINQAVQQGMIICAAVGNSGYGDSPVEYPAGYENVIGVGGVEPADCEKITVSKNKNTGEILGLEDDVIATFNNGYSEKYDLYLSDLVGNYQYTTDAVAKIPENSYTRWGMSTANESVFVSAPANLLADANYNSADYYNTTSCGTSVATPFVVAAAAGVKQMRPYIDMDMFKEILMATAVDLEDEGYDTNTGYGMVNFQRIYDYVSQMPLTAPERTPEVAIDYENEQLTGFTINREYTVNGEAVTLDDDFSLPIKEEWFGTTVSIVKKASSDSYEDSEPQLLYISDRPETPNIVLFDDNTVSVASGIAYKEESSDNWQTNSTDDTITLEPGKTYVFKVQYTENSFASEIREITVRFADVEQTADPTVEPSTEPSTVPTEAPTRIPTTEPTVEATSPAEPTASPTITPTAEATAEPTTEPIQEEYDIETYISYNRDTRECVFVADNKTGADISAVGIIAVYGQNGVFKYLETIDEFPADGINKRLDFTLTDGDTVKLFIWNSLQSVKPRDRVKTSKYTLE